MEFRYPGIIEIQIKSFLAINPRGATGRGEIVTKNSRLYKISGRFVGKESRGDRYRMVRAFDIATSEPDYVREVPRLSKRMVR